MSLQFVDALMRRSAGKAAKSVATDAKKTGKNKNKKAKNRCRQQVEECETFVFAACQGNPECIAEQAPCCEFLGTCNAAGFITCLNDVEEV